MSDDLVKQALAELGDIVRCRCHAAYTDRKLHDPDCNCDSAEALQIVADRIKALQAQLDKWNGSLRVHVKPSPTRPTPAPSPDDLVKAALEWAARTCDVATMDFVGDLIRGKGDAIRAAASDPTTVAAIIERAGK